MDISRMLMIAALTGITAIVRLADNSRKDIIKFSDMGATGFLLPMTDNAEDIRKVVLYAKYSPVGKRGISTMRAHTLYSPPEIGKYKEAANDKMKIYAQIETVSGVQNVGDILAEPGVDGCFIGPNDLSDDYGCLGEKQAPQILRAIEKVGKSAAHNGKQAGIITGNAAYVAAAKEGGFGMFCKGSELNAVKEYCLRVAETVR